MTSPMDALPEIGGPATRALADAGFTTLAQLVGLRRADLARLHGVGPKALRILEDALREHGHRLV